MAREETLHSIAESRCQNLQRKEARFKNFKRKLQLTYKDRNIRTTSALSPQQYSKTKSMEQCFKAKRGQ